MAFLAYNGKFLTRSSKWIGYGSPTPPTPTIPPYTIRMRFTEGVTPSFWAGTLTQVSASPNVWDLTYENSSWSYLLERQTDMLEILGANITGVTNLRALASRCSNLTSVALFDTSTVECMSEMFDSCSRLTTVPPFNTPNLTECFGMFSRCTNLPAVPLFNTSGCEQFSRMFEHCTSLTTVPLFDTSNATLMFGMFRYCNSLSSIPLLNTSKVTEMNSMFESCTSLTSVPPLDTAKVTTMDSMFNSCSSLTTVPLLDTSSCTDMERMFSGCLYVQSGALSLYQQASTQAIPPARHSATFHDCGRNTTTGAAELAQIPTSWGGTMA